MYEFFLHPIHWWQIFRIRLHISTSSQVDCDYLKPTWNVQKGIPQWLLVCVDLSLKLERDCLIPSNNILKNVGHKLMFTQTGPILLWTTTYTTISNLWIIHMTAYQICLGFVNSCLWLKKHEYEYFIWWVSYLRL